MNGFIKRTAALLLAGALLLALLPAPGAWAEEAAGSCGEDLRWSFEESTGVLTITGSGEMDDYPVEAGDGSVPPSVQPWREFRQSITALRLPDGLTGIGAYAFSGCTALTAAAIPDSVTRIGEAAFSRCRMLAAVNVPDGVPRIGSHTFYGCTALTAVTLPDSVTAIEVSAFQDCRALAELELSAGITDVGREAFSGCAALTEVTLPQGVARIGQLAFYGCAALADLTLPDSVESIGDDAFSGAACYETGSVRQDGLRYYGKWLIEAEPGITDAAVKPGTVGVADAAFEKCGALTSVTLPQGLTCLGGSAFSKCTALTEVEIPEGVERLGTGAFNGCVSLERVTLPQSLTGIGRNAFYNCAALSEIALPRGLKRIDASAFGGCAALAAVNIPDGVESIGEYAFEHCAALTEIRLPDSVTEVGQRAFESCAALTGATLGAGLRELAFGVFWNCAALTDLTLPEGLEKIGANAFSACVSLRGLALPGSVTEIGSSAFYGCTALSSVTLPEGLRTVGAGAFFNCDSLLLVRVPGSVTGIGTAAFGYASVPESDPPGEPRQTPLEGFTVECYIGTAAEAYALEHGFRCVVLGKYDPSGRCGESLTFFLNTETGVLTLEGSGEMSGAPWLRYKDEIKTLVLPKGLTAIAQAAFEDCRNLTEVSLPEGVSAVPDAAFRGCTALQSVVLPRSLQSIGAEAFLGVPAGSCVFRGYKNTLAERFAAQNGYRFDVLPDFSDVPAGAYYAAAVAWAAAGEIANGTGDGKFSPNETCTRAQVVTFLWRAAGKPKPQGAGNPFTDVKKGAYYADAARWAAEQGIANGTGDGKFSPNGSCTRAQVVTFLWRAAGKPEPESSENPFTDVAKGKFYCSAVLWAVEQGITKGTTKTEFSPEQSCTRGQIVTFLYRSRQ